MEQLIKEVQSCLKNENYYAAVTLCLTLPDIAAKVDYPDEKKVVVRYTKWYDDNVKICPYLDENDQKEKSVLVGKDCYALRCAVLHEGSYEMDETKNIQNYDTYQFLVSKQFPAPTVRRADGVKTIGIAKVTIFDAKTPKELPLFVDQFCAGIIKGVTEWMDKISGDVVKQSKLEKFAFIHIPREDNKIL